SLFDEKASLLLRLLLHTYTHPPAQATAPVHATPMGAAMPLGVRRPVRAAEAAAAAVEAVGGRDALLWMVLVLYARKVRFLVGKKAKEMVCDAWEGQRHIPLLAPPSHPPHHPTPKQLDQPVRCITICDQLLSLSSPPSRPSVPSLSLHPSPTPPSSICLRMPPPTTTTASSSSSSSSSHSHIPALIPLLPPFSSYSITAFQSTPTAPTTAATAQVPAAAVGGETGRAAAEAAAGGRGETKGVAREEAIPDVEGSSSISSSALLTASTPHQVLLRVLLLSDVALTQFAAHFERIYITSQGEGEEGAEKVDGGGGPGDGQGVKAETGMAEEPAESAATDAAASATGAEKRGKRLAVIADVEREGENREGNSSPASSSSLVVSSSPAPQGPTGVTRVLKEGGEAGQAFDEVGRRGEANRWGLREGVMVAAALEVMERRWAMVEPFEALHMLPSDVPLQSVLPYLEAVLRAGSEQRRNSAVVKNLRRSENLQLREELANGRKRHAIITGDRLCAICRKRIGGSVFAVYPGGTLVHFVCFQHHQTQLPAAAGP
ncbi:unnamed protein product, partial [Closterium sp. NIES-53]